MQRVSYNRTRRRPEERWKYREAGWIPPSRPGGRWRRIEAGYGPEISEEVGWGRELWLRLGDEAAGAVHLLGRPRHNYYASQTALFWFLALFAVAGTATLSYMLLRPLCHALARRLRLAKSQAACGDARVRLLLRRGREHSPHPPPTGEELEALWEASRPRAALEEKLKLGSRIADLEPVVDRSYVRNDEGEIVARNPGVRGWLGEHCPRLLAHYKTLMASKLLAEKFTMVCGNWSNADTAQEAMQTESGRKLLAEKRSMRALREALDARLGIEPRRRRPRAA